MIDESRNDDDFHPTPVSVDDVVLPVLVIGAMTVAPWGRR
jgi:hypothetical protein